MVSFISDQDVTKLHGSDQGVQLCDLQRFCNEYQIEIELIKGLTKEQGRFKDIANCELSGLSISHETLSLVDLANEGKLTAEEVIRLLIPANSKRH